MASVNKVIIMGNLGRDPEVRYTSDGAAICTITVATSRYWNDKASNEKREETEWHRIVFFGRQAEVAGEYLRKGRPVYVEGRIKTRKWQDKEGIERYTTEIVAESMQLLGGRDGAQQSSDEPPPHDYAAEQGTAAAPRGNPKRESAGKAEAIGDLDDDIPF